MIKNSFRVELDDGKSYVLYYEKQGKFFSLPFLWSNKYGLHRPGNVKRISEANFEAMAAKFNKA